jgi:hypothetical protein
MFAPGPDLQAGCEVRSDSRADGVCSANMIALTLTGVLGASFGDPAPPLPGSCEPFVVAESDAQSWTFDFVPYYWSASLDGNVAIDGQEIELEGGGDGAFGDPALIGFLGHFEARRGPWSFVYAPIFISADLKGVEPPVTDADVSIDAQIHEAFVARSFATGWDWMLGARYQELETDIDLSTGGVPIPSLGNTHSWIDPIVGVRYHTKLGEDWSVDARADVGGFGVGSDFVWNASVLAGYHFSPGFAVLLGYRALSFDFEERGGSDRLSYDLSMYGPILGVSFSF